MSAARHGRKRSSGTRLSRFSHRLGVAAILGTAAAASATTYYVAPPPAGSDGNTGTTVGEPWATLQFAASQVGAGDTVLVRAGDYAGMRLQTSGDVGSPITFMAYPAEEPVINADSPQVGTGIDVQASHIVIEGFTVEQRASYGIRVVTCEDVVVRGNRAIQSGHSGILAGHVTDVLLENNVVQGPGIEAAILMIADGVNVTVRGNDLSGHAGGVNLYGYTDDPGNGLFTGTILEGNVITQPVGATGSGIQLSGVQGALVRNNLLFDLPRYGVVLFANGEGGYSTGNRFFNNTIVSARSAIYALDGSSGTELRNNILFAAGASYGSIIVDASSLTGLDSDRNLGVDRFSADDGTTLLSLADWQIATGNDATSILSTPAATFVAPGADYSLLNPGPAIDAGLDLIDVPTDIDGVLRPFGEASDIGAYEWTNVLLNDGFETGGTGRWTSTLGG